MSSIQIGGMLFDDEKPEAKPHQSTSSTTTSNNLKKRTLDSFINDKTKKEIEQKERLFLGGASSSKQPANVAPNVPGGIALAMRSKNIDHHRDKKQSGNNTSLPKSVEELTKVSQIPARRTKTPNESIVQDGKKEEFSAVINNELFCPEPISSFSSQLSPVLISTLTKQMGIERLTKIQTRALSPILARSNVLMKSETGSGKTLAYLIPLIEMLYRQSLEKKISREDGTFAIILAPTRELCVQVDKVLKKITSSLNFIVCGGIMGGEKRKSEKERLRKGVNILVATPGRLEDHLRSTQSFACDQLKYLILDEADILLDFGFEERVKNIYQMIIQRKLQNPIISQNQTEKSLSDSIQKVLVSATLHSKIQTLAQQIDIVNATYIGHGSDGEFIEKVFNLITDKLPSNIFTIPAQLIQYAIIVPAQFRLAMLAGFLRSKTMSESLEQDPGKIIVFLSCCDSVEFHFNFFKYFQSKFKFIKEVVQTTQKKRSGAMETDYSEDAYRQMVKYETDEPLIHVPLFKLHGDIEQKERTNIFKQFSEAKEGILFCTDVAARGLDLPSVKWIVQYDPPGNPKEYLHRIGRTARMGVKGHAVMFLHPHEELYKKLLEKYKLTIHEIKGETCLESIILSFRRKSMRDPIEAASWLQNIFEQELVNSGKENTELYSLAVNAYFSYIKYYSTHGGDVKYIFHLNNLHLGHLAKSFALKDSPSKIKERQQTLGVKPLSVKKQELEAIYAMKDKLSKKEFLRRLKDVKGSSSIKSKDNKRKREDEEEVSQTTKDEEGYESFSDDDDDDEDKQVVDNDVEMMTEKNTKTSEPQITSSSSSGGVTLRFNKKNTNGGSKVISFGKPSNSDGTEASTTAVGSFSSSGIGTTTTTSVLNNNNGATTSMVQESKQAPKNVTTTTTAIPPINNTPQQGDNTLTPLQLRQMELKKKKLTPNERMKLYRDYEKGKIQPSRPKIVIPDGLRKNKKKNENDSGMGVSFDESKVVAKPVTEYDKLLSRYAGESTRTGRMMMSSTSEFDSSVPTNNRMRLNPMDEAPKRNNWPRGGGRGGGNFNKKRKY